MVNNKIIGFESLILAGQVETERSFGEKFTAFWNNVGGDSGRRGICENIHTRHLSLSQPFSGILVTSVYLFIKPSEMSY